MKELKVSKILPGKKIGRITIIERNGSNSKRSAVWVCSCSCGNIKNISSASLITTRSCGCLQKERVSAAAYRHGYSHKTEYSSWEGLRQRCLNPSNPRYKDYGGRGILVCKRWDKFENFIKDMGNKPSKKHSIDRIDNDGNYEPSNCRWATKKQQMITRRIGLKPKNWKWQRPRINGRFVSSEKFSKDRE